MITTKTMILKSIFISYATLIFLVSMSESHSLKERGTITDFTTDLIHRDYSPKSPSYDPSLSPSQRTVKALRRSLDRVQRFKKLDSSSKQIVPESEIHYTTGEYMMTYSVGTPPVPLIALVSTSSEITWMQCEPCIHCFNQSLPLFQPRSSSTYRKIPCNSTMCDFLRNSASCSQNKRDCLYSMEYVDKSFTHGEFASDTFSMAEGTVSIPNVTFGCGFDNGGPFSGSESGIVALGGGARSRVSFVSQMGSLGEGKFSYCLGSSKGELAFGSGAEVSGRGAVSTPLIEKPPSALYYLTMEGISVGNQTLEFSSDIVIDAGTKVTMLPRDFYNKLEDAVKSSVSTTLLRIADPARLFNLCYKLDKEGGDMGIPDVTVHLKGADLKLKQENIFVRTSAFSVCLAANPTDDVAVYGTMAQINFLVGYDLVKGTVSFMPTNCGK